MNQKIGTIYPGQGWVELHGEFTIKELEEVLKMLNRHYERVPVKNGDQNRSFDKLGS
jgi:glycerol kinase